MKHIYTIVSGIVEYENQKCKIPFALIFELDGVFYIETFFSDDKFHENTKGLSYYRLIGKTEKGYDIECEELFCTRYCFENQKVVFVCNKFIKLINNKRNQDRNLNKEEIPIYFAELEGMKMQFGNHTEIEQFRNSGKVDNLLNYEFDHTDCTFLINIPGFIGNSHRIVFIRNPENENILVDFRNVKGYSELTYDKYRILQEDLLSFLSFINGNHIRLRKELLGDNLTIKGANKGYDAQTVIFYSFRHKETAYQNDYLPINNHHSYTSEIFRKIFISGFDKFYHLNKNLDFNSIIFSLNSTNSVDLEEKYFILITALERISKNYANSNSDKSTSLIDDSFFKNTIKIEINQLLKRHKTEIDKQNKAAYAIFNSKIGNLNNRNSAETSQKLYELFKYAKIKITEPIISLIEVERNKAVHEGIIGNDDSEQITNYWKLDHVLRDIILNLIDYKGIRERKFDYEKNKIVSH